MDPVLTMALYWFLFGFLLGGRGSVENYTGFLAAGVFCFAIIRQSITAGSRSISGNEGLVRSIHFPRAVLPIAVVMKQLRVFYYAIPIMVVILLITGEPITWRWLLAPVGLLLIVMFSLGMALIMARVIATVQDVSEILGYLLRIWGYMSGVMIPIADRLSRLGLPPWAVFFIEINPGTVYLNVMRDALMASYDSRPRATTTPMRRSRSWSTTCTSSIAFGRLPINRWRTPRRCGSACERGGRCRASGRFMPCGA